MIDSVTHEPKPIPNVGNTCYFNSLMQCLDSCLSLKSMIIDDRGTDAIVMLIKDFFTSTYVPIDPRPLLKAMFDSFRSRLNLIEQNDISELYAILMDHILRATGQPISEGQMHAIDEYIQTHVEDTLRKRAELHWYKSHSTEFSKLCGVVCGQQVCQVHCGNCNALHHNYEIVSAVMLSLPETNICNSLTLHDLMMENYKDEILDDWVCDKCRQQSTRNTRTVRQWRNPQVLVVVMKRFSAPSQRKVPYPVDFPLEIDMAPYTIGPCNKQNCMYTLKAIACHYGSATCGHYVAFVKRDTKRDTKSWYCVDDDHVTPISEDGMYNQSRQHCYMLFYENIGGSDV